MPRTPRTGDCVRPHPTVGVLQVTSGRRLDRLAPADRSQRRENRCPHAVVRLHVEPREQGLRHPRSAHLGHHPHGDEAHDGLVGGKLATHGRSGPGAFGKVSRRPGGDRRSEARSARAAHASGSPGSRARGGPRPRRKPGRPPGRRPLRARGRGRASRATPLRRGSQPAARACRATRERAPGSRRRSGSRAGRRSNGTGRPNPPSAASALRESRGRRCRFPLRTWRVSAMDAKPTQSTIGSTSIIRATAERGHQNDSL